ncbi:MAG: helix-turn-helix domain-containing protein, partial [Solirubrobacterales bacterium]
MSAPSDDEGSVRPVGEEIHVDLGGRIPHLWMEGGRSTLDLIGPGLTVLTGPWGGGRCRNRIPSTARRPVRAGVSQRELAERAGTAQAAISRIETGREQPTVDRLAQVLAALGWRMA